jgi:Rps23 Pro-64 3,4-dihydroxylase Tpa1-like proline 4-hydroxylase
MCEIRQYSEIPYEIFTIDNIYTDSEIEHLKKLVENADNKNRTFTCSNFKNGKVVNEQLSNIIYEKLTKSLPVVYKDRQGISYNFVGTPKFIMYAKVKKNQLFSIHTDTGAEYDEINNKYSKFTVLTYLNDDYEGGNTKFFDYNFKETVKINPKKNRTLIFDIDLYHSGEEVKEGNKYWIGTELVVSKFL